MFSIFHAGRPHHAAASNERHVEPWPERSQNESHHIGTMHSCVGLESASQASSCAACCRDGTFALEACSCAVQVGVGILRHLHNGSITSHQIQTCGATASPAIGISVSCKTAQPSNQSCLYLHDRRHLTPQGPCRELAAEPLQLSSTSLPLHPRSPAARWLFAQRSSLVLWMLNDASFPGSRIPIYMMNH